MSVAQAPSLLSMNRGLSGLKAARSGDFSAGWNSSSNVSSGIGRMKNYGSSLGSRMKSASSGMTGKFGIGRMDSSTNFAGSKFPSNFFGARSSIFDRMDKFQSKSPSRLGFFDQLGLSGPAYGSNNVSKGSSQKFEGAGRYVSGNGRRGSYGSYS